MKLGSFAGRRFHPDLASTSFHDLLADGESHPGPGVFRRCRMEAFKHTKYLSMEFRRDADTVIADDEMPVVLVAGNCDMDFGRFVVAAVFDGIADQILKQLFDVYFLHEQYRENIMSDRGVTFPYCQAQILQHSREDVFHLYRLGVVFIYNGDAGVGQQVGHKVPDSLSAGDYGPHKHLALFVKVVAITLAEQLCEQGDIA